MKKNSAFKSPVIWLSLAVFVSCLWTVWFIYQPRDNQIPADDFQGEVGVSLNAAEEPVIDAEVIRFKRNAGAIDYSGVIFTPWDVSAASANVAPRAPKAYTVMIYMNGSDLESEDGSATIDLDEILRSGVRSEDVNIIIFTGGANRWQNNFVPENDCVIWEISNGTIYKTAGVGLLNMGNPGTLSSFIDFSIKNFPAEKYGLIMWDHGGGSIAGYGHDEKFINGNLTLLDINYAFEKSGLREKKLEFLGFDSCLMASAEMAVVASEYAKYLIASEDLIPADGWNYSFLSVFNANPRIDGLSLGVKITDSFIDFYGPNPDFELNMSVIDLSKAAKVMDSMGNLMGLCSGTLLENMHSSFNTLSKKRNNTKTFGIGSPRDNECDMIDVGDMARQLSDLFPEEAGRLLSDLKSAVLYNRHNSNINLSGLSAYYIYGGKSTGKESLDIYASLVMDDEYTGYLHRFFSMLINSGTPWTSFRSRASGNIAYNNDIIKSDLTLWQPLPGKAGYYMMAGIKNDIESQGAIDAIESPWPKIKGQNVCLYEINRSDGNIQYAIPAALNGKDCDIIVLLSEKYPGGKILGARNQDGVIIQKGYDELKAGDKLCFYFQERYFGNGNNDDILSIEWIKGDELTINGGLRLEWSPPGDGLYYSLCLTDTHNIEDFTPLKEVA